MNLHTEGKAAGRLGPSPRANWRRVTDDHLGESHISFPPALSLDKDGMIQDCSRSAERLFGYSRSELVWQHVSCLFPQLSDVELVRDDRLNPMLNYICHCDHNFEAIDKNSEVIVCNLNFFSIDYDGTHIFRLVVRPVGDAK